MMRGHEVQRRNLYGKNTFYKGQQGQFSGNQ